MQSLRRKRLPEGYYAENIELFERDTSDESSDEDDLFVLNDAEVVGDRFDCIKWIYTFILLAILFANMIDKLFLFANMLITDWMSFRMQKALILTQENSIG